VRTRSPRRGAPSHARCASVPSRPPTHRLSPLARAPCARTARRAARRQAGRAQRPAPAARVVAPVPAQRPASSPPRARRRPRRSRRTPRHDTSDRPNAINGAPHRSPASTHAQRRHRLSSAIKGPPRAVPSPHDHFRHLQLLSPSAQRRHRTHCSTPPPLPSPRLLASPL
jgi:hypothetical protein